MATIRENPDLDLETSSKILKEAMQGLGTSEKDIIDELAKHTLAQRIEIADYYKTAYGEDLVEQLKGELGGNLEDVIVAMLTPPRVYDARQLKKAMAGAGTSESALIEILCSRSNDEKDEIKTLYEEEFESTLESDIMGDTSGHVRRLLVSEVNAGRDEDRDTDSDQAEEDARTIFEAGQEQWGTDEAEINSVLCTRNYRHLKRVFRQYQELAGKSIEEAIDSECDGTLQEGYLAIISYARDVATFFAERLYKSMKGGGTDDDTLIRIIVSRSEIDMAYIKETFKEKYEISLPEYIDSDCGGDYQRILLALVGADE